MRRCYSATEETAHLIKSSVLIKCAVRIAPFCDKLEHPTRGTVYCTKKKLLGEEEGGTRSEALILGGGDAVSAHQ
jgi:hypothetical protein